MPLITRADLDLVAPYLLRPDLPPDVQAAALRIIRAPDIPGGTVIPRNGEPLAIVLARTNGRVTAADLMAQGVSDGSARSNLSQLHAAGRLRRVSTGVYALPLAVASGG
jgi:hypothetical protein